MAEVSRSVGRYLCAVQLLAMDGDGRARTSDLADRLGVRAASVTEMLAALEDRGLATYEKYEGVELTPEGEAVARELLWKHCVAENFLREEAGAVAAGEVAGGTDDGTSAGADDGVGAFGRTLSDEVADRLRAYIDHPCDGRCGAPTVEYAECRADVRERGETVRDRR